MNKKHINSILQNYSYQMKKTSKKNFKRLNYYAITNSVTYLADALHETYRPLALLCLGLLLNQFCCFDKYFRCKSSLFLFMLVCVSISTFCRFYTIFIHSFNCSFLTVLTMKEDILSVISLTRFQYCICSICPFRNVMRKYRFTCHLAWNNFLNLGRLTRPK